MWNPASSGRPLLVLGAALALAACGAGDSAQAPAAPEVGFITVRAESAALTTELPGRTVPYMVSDVRPQVSGIIRTRLFEEGAAVSKGQTLYQIDPAPYQAAYNQAQATLARAEATLRAVASRAARTADLADVDAVSKQEAEDAASAHGQAMADVAAARAGVEAARINLGYTRITAPISGRIGRSAITPGALVTADQPTPLATIQALDPIYVDVTRSSTELLKLRRTFGANGGAGKDDVTARVELTLQDGTRYPTPGELKFSEVSVDPRSGAVVLRAVFPNRDGMLMPGMYVRATLTEGVDEQAIVVPQRAITRDQRGRPYAMVVGQDNKVEQRFVEAPRTIGNRWLITDGLKEGDRVVVEGLQRAAPGAVVKPVEAKAAALTPAKAG